MFEEIKTIRSGPRELRQFGFVMAAALGIIAGILIWRHGRVHPVLPLIAAGFLVPPLLDTLFGLRISMILLPLHKAWMALAVVLGFVMSHVILAVLFFVVFTALGVVGRLAGKSFLDLKWRDPRESFWIPREPGSGDARRSEKQF